METPGARSSKEIIVKDTYITGRDENDLKKAENCLLFIDSCTSSLSLINEYIADLNHEGLGETICNLKQPLLAMGYAPLYSTAIALENELLMELTNSPDFSETLLTKGVELLCYSSENETSSLQESLKSELLGLLPMFVVPILAAVENRETPELQEEFVMRLLGGVGVDSTLLGVYLDSFERVPIRDQVSREVISRFVRGQVLGKKLITGPSAFVRLVFLSCCLEILNFYQDALGTLSQEKHFSMPDLEWCFDLIETEVPKYSEGILASLESLESNFLGFVEASLDGT